MQHIRQKGSALSAYSQRLLRVLGLFGLSVALLSGVRFFMFLWNFPQYSEQAAASLLTAFTTGIRFDLAASTWLILPVLFFSFIPWPSRAENFWKRTVFAIYILIEVPFLAVNLIDVELVNYVGRRMTADVLFLLQEAEGKMGGYWSAFKGIVILSFAILIFQIWASWMVLKWQPRRPKWAPQGRAARVGLVFAIIIWGVIASRGGLQKKPVSFVNANVFEEPVLNNLVLNTSFNILKSLDQEKLPRVKYMSDDDMLKNLNGAVKGPSLLDGLRPKTPQNVVVLMLESFDRSYMGRPNHRAGFTPFLDSMIDRGLFFNNAFANGRRSIEGICAVLAGIPALMNEPFITSPFTADKFVGLGTAVERKGYDTSFFHGGNNGTMHFDAFMPGIGIQHYYGAREYPNPKDNDGVWGIYDGPFMDWMLKQINQKPQPFMVSFFSISSHQPYLIPDDVASKYADGPIPILKTISYTDDVLRQFFEAASKQPWYDHTLFVITADHALIAADPKEDTEIDHYRIPILFFHPKFQWPKTIDQNEVAQQIDILPSILDFLGLPLDETIPLARSVFVPGEKTATMFQDGNYTLASKDYYLSMLRGEETPQMYKLEDTQKKAALIEPQERKKALETRLKASIQMFSEGMWENRLIFQSH